MRKISVLIAMVVLQFGGTGLQAADADSQKAVLITGATSGIGRMAAEQLAANGYYVYAGARKPEDMAELNKIRNIQAVRLDVTVQADIDAAVEHIRAEGRGLWGLVNNAGVNVVGMPIEMPVEDFDFLFDVNVRGVYVVTKAFAPLIIESQGRIVNISSISGMVVSPPYAVYSMTKHAVEAYTDALSQMMERLGVFVAAVEPGNYKSEIGMTRCKRMLANEEKHTSAYFPEVMKFFLDDCRKRIDSGVSSTAGEPTAVADAIEHALFDEQPKNRYLVLPSEDAIEWVFGTLFARIAAYNHDHEYSLSRDELIEILDRELDGVAGRGAAESERP